jgi:hypothetical protein
LLCWRHHEISQDSETRYARDLRQRAPRAADVQRLAVLHAALLQRAPSPRHRRSSGAPGLSDSGTREFTRWRYEFASQRKGEREHAGGGWMVSGETPGGDARSVSEAHEHSCYVRCALTPLLTWPTVPWPSGMLCLGLMCLSYALSGCMPAPLCFNCYCHARWFG